MRRLAGGLVAAALLLAAVVGLTTTAGAQQTGGTTLTIREVDTTNFPEVRISAFSDGEAPSLADFTLRENGRLIPDFRLVPIADTDTTVGIVLLMDISFSMRENDALRQAKIAAKQFVDQRRPNERIALVSFGSEATVRVNFTADNEQLKQAIDDLSVIGQTALWDGVRESVQLFENRPELQANVVLLSDGTDTSSVATEVEARGAAQSANATIFAVGLEGAEFDPTSVQRVAQATGGTYSAASDPTALSQIYGSIQESLQNQYEVQYTSRSQDGAIDLVLAARGLQATASVNAGTVSAGQAAQPEIIKPGDQLLSGDVALWLGILLAFVAVGMAVYAVIFLLGKEESTLRSLLRPYASHDSGVDEDDEAYDMAQTPFMQRAVAATEQFAKARGFLPRVEAALERADLPLRAAEAILFYVVGVVVLAVLGFAFTQNAIGGLIITLIVGLVPPAAVSFLAGQRRRKFVSQLPDTLQLLAGSLRAGYSLMQGVEAVAQEVEEPMGKELRRVLAESRLGRPLEEALEDAASRMDSPDFHWAVMAIRIQREVGGNLAELLMTVSETMVARERLRREVRALTAEGRISAIILGLLPVGIGVAIFSLNREYMEILFEETVGQFMLGGSIVLAIIGFYWMKKTIEIEI